MSAWAADMADANDIDMADANDINFPNANNTNFSNSSYISSPTDVGRVQRALPVEGSSSGRYPNSLSNGGLRRYHVVGTFTRRLISGFSQPAHVTWDLG